MGCILGDIYLEAGLTPATAAYDEELHGALRRIYPTTFNGTLPVYVIGDLVSGGARARVERRLCSSANRANCSAHPAMAVRTSRALSRSPTSDLVIVAYTMWAIRARTREQRAAFRLGHRRRRSPPSRPHLGEL